MHRNTTIIKSTQDMKISFNGLEMKLVISNTKEEYTGTYKVVVSNEMGKDESSAELTVKVSLIEKSINNRFLSIIDNRLIDRWID